MDEQFNQQMLEFLKSEFETFKKCFAALEPKEKCEIWLELYKMADTHFFSFDVDEDDGLPIIGNDAYN